MAAQVHTVSAGRKSYINAIVHQHLGAAGAGDLDRIKCESEEFAVSKVFLSDLNHIDSGCHRLLEKRI